jgi:hypothetical protein
MINSRYNKYNEHLRESTVHLKWLVYCLAEEPQINRQNDDGPRPQTGEGTCCIDSVFVA